MQDKHLKARIAQCLAIAECSSCPRRKFGALLLDPERNTLLLDSYNGGPRGAVGKLCGGHVCDRDEQKVPSGTRMEVGCHHAESNLVANAAARGVRCDGAWLIVTGEPCTRCARLIHHAGIRKVLCVKGGYAGGDGGVGYLRTHGVEVEYVEGPQDPRNAPVTPASAPREGVPLAERCQEGCGYPDCDNTCCPRGVTTVFSRDFDSTMSLDCDGKFHLCDEHEGLR